MNATQLLSELGNTLGVTLELSADNTCSAIFDEDEIDFELSNGYLYIIAEIAPLQEEVRILKRLLQANSYGRDTGGACIGIDPDREAFVMHRMLSLPLPYEELEKSMTLFIKALRYWKMYMSSASGSPLLIKPSETASRAVINTGIMA